MLIKQIKKSTFFLNLITSKEPNLVFSFVLYEKFPSLVLFQTLENENLGFHSHKVVWNFENICKEKEMIRHFDIDFAQRTKMNVDFFLGNGFRFRLPNLSSNIIEEEKSYNSMPLNLNIFFEAVLMQSKKKNIFKASNNNWDILVGKHFLRIYMMEPY